MGEINSFPIQTKTILDLDAMPASALSNSDPLLIYDESVGVWKTIEVSALKGGNYTIDRAIDFPSIATELGDVYTTLGANSVGDGGAGVFDIIETPPYAADGYSVIQTASGWYAVLRPVNGFVNIEQFGTDGTTGGNTLAIQRAIDACFYSSNCKTVLLRKIYSTGASSLSETYDNAGAPVNAYDCSIVLRKGVSLIGNSSRDSGIVTNPLLISVAVVAPDDQSIENISIDGTWEAGQGGAGHGIFVLGTSGGADISCNKLRLKSNYVHNVASYGFGLQNGSPSGCVIENCETYYTGADGFDLKARSDASNDPVGNTVKNCKASRFNMRVDGSAGIDIRGVWQLSGITIKDFGEMPGKNYTGIRFRTKPPVTDIYNKAAAKSTLFGFDISSDSIGSVTGIESGSDDVKVSAGHIINVTNGVILNGNVNGSATRNVLNGVTVRNASADGFKNLSGVANSVFESCFALSCNRGFRLEGTGNKLSACESDGSTPVSISVGASPTTIVDSACKFGADSQASFYQGAIGRLTIEPKGQSANIDVHVATKGSGKLMFGEHTVNADTVITGYIQIKDASGTIRKLAVIT